jgi:bacillithiol biosynthesis cysteine-adding enzyme BshC
MASFSQLFQQQAALPKTFAMQDTRLLCIESAEKVTPLPTIDCLPIQRVPGLSRLFTDFCSGAAEAQRFYGPADRAGDWKQRPDVPEHWEKLVEILAEQNSGAAGALDALRSQAGTVLTGQQVGLFGGQLLVPFKAATAVARAREASRAERQHVPVFWLASEDHDFEEVRSVTFPGRRELRTLTYNGRHEAGTPVGGVVLDDSINALLDEAGELIGWSDALEALTAAYQPGRTLAQAFGDFYRRVFAAQGLLVIDPCSRPVHALGAPVLRAAIERADELHAALLERNGELEAAGYHAQVAVTPNSSLLFLLDAATGERKALKRTAATANEPQGFWQAGRERLSTADLLGIMEAQPERISPSALLRPVFQDFLFSSSLTIGGPAEIAYFAQSAVLYERILGRMTPVQARFSATIVEPDIAELLRKHELSLDRILEETEDSLTQLLAARAIPIEGKRKLASAGNALDAELTALLEWMRAMDAGLGQSADRSASKMRYQMNRLRRMAANFQVQKEASLARHAQALHRALNPQGHLQERVHGAAWYLARHGFEMVEEMVQSAASGCTGHATLWV